MGKKAYIKQAAEELGFTDYQLRRMAKEHKIPFLMSGTRYIFDVELCQEYLRSQALKNTIQEDKSIEYGKLRKVQG